ncbi:hypothetical protein EYC80_008157 [Monilinia laxa]|uniref:Uncharacterized protein n=1 Tax=Monilinia laxa TaxID=61186 RepID=A0A5N6JVL4_MONLA|nr:hypothetical protein EYC80_008157 [Monilinia laxa]
METSNWIWICIWIVFTPFFIGHCLSKEKNGGSASKKLRKTAQHLFWLQTMRVIGIIIRIILSINKILSICLEIIMSSFFLQFTQATLVRRAASHVWIIPKTHGLGFNGYMD